MDSTAFMTDIGFSVGNLNELVGAAAKILHPLNDIFSHGSSHAYDQLHHVTKEFEDLSDIFSSCLFYCKNILETRSYKESSVTEVQQCLPLPEVSVIEPLSDSTCLYNSFVVERHDFVAKNKKGKRNRNTNIDHLRKYIFDNERELASLRKRKAALEKTLVGQLHTGQNFTNTNNIPTDKCEWNPEKSTFQNQLKTSDAAQGHHLDEIYSEAALFISQNETRPTFLIDIFKVLQGLDDTIHCEKCLQQLSNFFADHLQQFTSEYHCFHAGDTFSSGQIDSDQSLLDSTNFEMSHLDLLKKSVHATSYQCISQVLDWMSSDENISTFSECKIRILCLNQLMDAVQNCQDIIIQGIKYIPTQSFLAKFEASLHENLSRVWKDHVKELLSLISETVLTELSTKFQETQADDGTRDCDQAGNVTSGNVSSSDQESPDSQKATEPKNFTSHTPDKCQSQEAVVFDLSASETKPLTSYGSGEDEDDGSGEEYHVSEVDIATSMQHNTC